MWCLPHKVDDQHHDMPLIYYMEGHNLHFGRREFSLITGFRFGTVSFDLHSSGELKFQNRVFPNKIGFSITNLDIIGVIKDEEMFGKLSDDDAIRLCLLLALEVIFMGHLLTFNVDDTLFSLVGNIEAWNSFPWGEHLWCHLYNEIKNLKERHGDEHYYGLFKDRNYVPTYTLSGFVFAFQIWILETFERCESWWIKDPKVIPRALESMFADLIEPTDPDEDIAQDYLREEELRLCLEGEEKMRCEHQKLIVEENRIRLDEAKRLRLEEENMLQLEQQKKNKQKEFMNSSHCKNLLSKLAPAKRIQLCSSSEKIKPKVSWVKIKKYRQQVYDPCIAEFLKNVKPWVEDTSRVLQSMDTIWLSDDIERFLGQSGQIKCKFPWNDDYIVDRNFWLKLVCLDPARKGWLTEELLLQKGMPLFYANGERYTTPWSEVDQVFIPINETGEHWCLAQFHIMSGEVTFYDTGHTYDYDYRDWSTVVAESVRLLQKFQQDDLESSRGMMRLICETRLKVQLPVVLERANIFQKNGIDPSKLAHGLSLDVDDFVDFALAYREKMFSQKPSTSSMDNSKRIDDSTENFSLFEVNYDGMFDERPLRYAYGKVLPLKFSNSNRMTYSEILDMLVYKLECEIRALFYSIPRNSLETEKKKRYCFSREEFYVDFLHADCVDDHFGVLDYWSYEDVYGGGCFDFYGSFKGFDCIEEPVGCDDGLLPGKIKDEFSNEVNLDDVVSSLATLSMLLKRKGKSRVKFTRMRGIIKRSKMVSLRMRVRSNY
ncbi:phospholipase-like protein [Tanacetum coccineum]